MTTWRPPSTVPDVGHVFRDPRLLERALTHRSLCNELPEVGPDNEALEFLGDAALELWVRTRLHERMGEVKPGPLSEAADLLVSREALADVARELGLGAHLRLGRGMEHQGGRDRASLLANGLEAVIGAVYLDGGWPAAAALCARWMETRAAAVAEGRARTP
jgi:ribonuclease-3